MLGHLKYQIDYSEFSFLVRIFKMLFTLGIKKKPALLFLLLFLCCTNVWGMSEGPYGKGEVWKGTFVYDREREING